jgi:hypothetical protein
VVPSRGVVDGTRRSCPLDSAAARRKALERDELADWGLDGISLEADDEPDLERLREVLQRRDARTVLARLDSRDRRVACSHPFGELRLGEPKLGATHEHEPRRDWSEVPGIALNEGESENDLVTLSFEHDEAPTVGRRLSAVGRWKLEREGVAALPVGDGFYSLRGVEGTFANWGDTVRCVAGPNGRLIAEEIVAYSGHRTFRALASDRKDSLLLDVVQRIERDGGRVVNAAGRLWLVDVPPTAIAAHVGQVLREAQSARLLRYEDAAEGKELIDAAWSESARERSFWRRVWHYRARLSPGARSGRRIRDWRELSRLLGICACSGCSRPLDRVQRAPASSFRGSSRTLIDRRRLGFRIPPVVAF